MTTYNILVVDDEKSIRSSLKMILEYSGYRVIEAHDGASAIEVTRKSRPDLVLLDIKMTGMDGLEVLEQLHQDYPNLPVIILSGHGTVSTAVKATKLGAFDFLEKPPERERILLAVKNALSLNRLQVQEELEISNIDTQYRIVGTSQSLLEVTELIQKIAPSNISVLVRGESGTGKELAARQIHHLSKRVSGPFVQVNCAAIPEDLIENELFGHEKGSYTGATNKQLGKFELAHKGTLFLDEIGDMSLKTQAKVLRAIQEGEFQRVGGAQILHSDVRIIAATNQDLEEMIQEGSFREDLYYRINVIQIYMPALREHPDDIPPLIDFFSQKLAKENGVQSISFTEKALDHLKQATWRGNVRQLRNFVEKHLILHSGQKIQLSDIESEFQQTMSNAKKSNEIAELQYGSLQEFKEASEKKFLIQKLNENNWNIKATAESIGTPRSNLYKRIQFHNIERAEKEL